MAKLPGSYVWNNFGLHFRTGVTQILHRTIQLLFIFSHEATVQCLEQTLSSETEVSRLIERNSLPFAEPEKFITVITRARDWPWPEPDIPCPHLTPWFVKICFRFFYKDLVRILQILRAGCFLFSDVLQSISSVQLLIWTSQVDYYFFFRFVWSW